MATDYEISRPELTQATDTTLLPVSGDHPIDQPLEEKVQQFPVEENVSNPQELLTPQETQADSLTPRPGTVEAWAESLFDKNNPEANEAVTIMLSRYGLKTSQDVVKFLKSPAGETVVTELGEQIAIEEAREEQKQFAVREETIRTHRILSLLFAAYLAKEAHADHQRKEEIEKQNEKAIKDANPNAHAAQDTSPDPAGEKETKGLMESLGSINNEIKVQEEKIKENKAAIESLENEAKELIQIGIRIEKKYAAYKPALEQIDAHNQAEYTADKLDALIQEFSARMEQQATQINEIVEMDEKAYALMNAHNALNIELGHFQDLKAVMQGKKYFADAEGNTVKSAAEAAFVFDVTIPKDHDVMFHNDQPHLFKMQVPPGKDVVSYDNQQLLVDKGTTWKTLREDPGLRQQAKQNYQEELNKQWNAVTNDKDTLDQAAAQYQQARLAGPKIEKDAQGNHYLLSKGQQLADMDPAAKQQAQNAYEKKKHEMMTVKLVVHQNKSTEDKVHGERLDNNKNNLENRKADAKVFDNQMQVLQTAKSSVETALNAPKKAFNPTPLPDTLTPNTLAKNNSAQLFKQRVQSLKSSSDITANDLYDLADNAPPNRREEARKYVSAELALARSSRQANIPQQTMQNLLRNMEKFGVDATKPSVTAIQGPLNLQKQTEQKENTQESQKDTYQSPTPLSTRPY